MHCYAHSYGAMSFSVDELKLAVDRVKVDLANFMSKVDTDTIVVRGMSGVSMAFALRASGFSAQLVILRKKEDKHHGHTMSAVGEKLSVINYVILDDLMDSGDTVNGIKDDMQARCAGIFLYAKAHIQGNKAISRSYFSSPVVEYT
jgi:orotate phosphoribosyltransferase-like protein